MFKGKISQVEVRPLHKKHGSLVPRHSFFEGAAFHQEVYRSHLSQIEEIICHHLILSICKNSKRKKLLSDKLANPEIMVNFITIINKSKPD